MSDLRFSRHLGVASEGGFRDIQVIYTCRHVDRYAGQIHIDEQVTNKLISQPKLAST